MNALKRFLRNSLVVYGTYCLSAVLFGLSFEYVTGAAPTAFGMTWFSLYCAVIGGLVTAHAAFLLGAREPGAVGFVVGVVVAFGGDLIGIATLSACSAAGAYLLSTRKRRARIEKLRARQREVQAARLARARSIIEERKARSAEVKKALKGVDTGWLIDVFGRAETTGRASLLLDLKPEAAYGLARLHRRGIPADFVASVWTLSNEMNEATADAITREHRASVPATVGGAS